jgi:hypothetical protein
MTTADTSNPTPRIPTQTPWPIRYSDGSVVEVIGIRSEAEPDGPWWAADGSIAPAPTIRDSSQLSLPSFLGRNVRFVVRLNDASQAGNAMRVDVGQMLTFASSATSSSRSTTMNMVVALPSTLETAPLRIGLAGGRWNDTVIYDVAASKRTSAGASPLTVGTITEENGKTMVQVYDSRWQSSSDRQEEVVLLANGQIVTAQTSRRASLLANYVHTYECRKDQVSQVIFRWRPYEWMEMKNVSLRPTTAPTQVSIGPATQPSTVPIITGTTP